MGLGSHEYIVNCCSGRSPLLCVEQNTSNIHTVYVCMCNVRIYVCMCMYASAQLIEALAKSELIAKL